MLAGWAVRGEPYCRRCRLKISRALGRLPEQYVRLWVRLGDKPPSWDDKVSGSRTPPVPPRLDFDALLRDMVAIMSSWEIRVAAAAGTSLNPELARYRRHERALSSAVRLLTGRMDKLLTLPTARMTRNLSLPAAAKLLVKSDGVVHAQAGYAEVRLPLDGACAGQEILRLHHTARALLGETLPPPERLDGIPCRRCDALGLEAAPEPEYKSVCTNCGDILTPDEYRTHTIRYSKWVAAQTTAVLLEAS